MGQQGGNRRGLAKLVQGLRLLPFALTTTSRLHSCICKRGGDRGYFCSVGAGGGGG